MKPMISEPRIAISHWQVLGAFPNKPGNDSLENGLSNEAALAIGGDPVEGREWRLWNAHPLNFLEADLHLGALANSFVYAGCYVISREEQDALLWLGSDDGVATWVNGQKAHWNDTSRMETLDNDRVPIRLKRGWNSLLFKVSQGGGGWGLSARIEPSRGPGSVTLSAIGSTQKNPAGLVLGMNSLVLKGRDGRPGRPTEVRPTEYATDRRCGTHAPYPSRPDRVGSFESKSFSVCLPIRVMNADGEPQSSFRIQLAGGDGVLSDVKAGPLAGFASTDISLSFSPQEAFAVLAQGRDLLMLTTGRGTHVAPLPQLAQNSLLLLGLEQAALRAGPVIKKLVGDIRTATSEFGLPLPDDRRAAFASLAGGRLADIQSAAVSLLSQLRAGAADRSRQVVTLVGHAHIDMNWLWEMAETRKVVHDTFRQVLAFMREYPDFIFSQSQSAVYRIIEEMDPPMFRDIQRRVKEGRWELLGGMVDEGDTNLSGGEALARSFLLGQGYFHEKFGRRATVGWLPDNFGHIAQLPQLLRLAGMDAFYAHRCQPTLGLSTWEGVDGSRVLNYATPTYNGEVNLGLREVPERYDPDAGQLMWVYGVGDHGGGPTRADIERAKRYSGLPGFPQVRFGTAAAFFKTQAKQAKKRPVHKGELQYAFRGCYTSVARIKEGNRRCENTLYLAEWFSFMAALNGFAYPTARLNDSWQKLTFNQFHDILCGSATYGSNRESVGSYDVAWDTAQRVLVDALRHQAAAVPTASDRGQPVVLFNTRPLARRDVVEVELFSYTQPDTVRNGHWGLTNEVGDRRGRVPEVEAADMGQGNMPMIQLTDETGRPVDAQVVGGSSFPNGYRMRVQFDSGNVPAGGHRVFYARPDQGDHRSGRGLRVADGTIETEALIVEWSATSGLLTRIYDKKQRFELLPKDAAAGALKISMEEPHNMTAWDIGRFTKEIILNKAEELSIVETGPVRACIEAWYRWGQSTFIQRAYVYRALGRIDFELEAHWFERGDHWGDSPMLSVCFPTSIKKGTFVCDTPFAAVERPNAEADVPAQRWVDLSDGRRGAALLNTGKYGFRQQDGVIEMSLLRASTDPDPYPDLGIHKIRYSLVPHAGDWKKGHAAEEGAYFNTPMQAVETPPGQKGGRIQSQFALEPGNVMLDGLKRAEDGKGWIVRYHETVGKTTMVRLTLPLRVKSAKRVNLVEQPLPGAVVPRISGTSVALAVKPYEIVSLRLVLASSLT